jgi:tripartite-type tricarboxylate transporter receptor subunit TctC
MPGAGSLTSVLHLNGSAPTDGTTIVAFNAGVLNDSMSEGAAARAKFTDYAWIGSITRDFRVCFAWRGTGILNWDDLAKRKESVFGAAGAVSSSANNIAMLRNLLNVNLKTIHGYPGNTEMFLAIERGELDGSCVTWSSLPDHWVKNNTISVLTRLSPSTQPGVPESVKFVGDLVTTQEQKDILDVLLASGELGRPFITSPKVPADRLQALRAAFDASMKDTAFLGDAEKQKLPIDPVGGVEAEKIVTRLYAFPAALVEKAKNAVK